MGFHDLYQYEKAKNKKNKYNKFYLKLLFNIVLKFIMATI